MRVIVIGNAAERRKILVALDASDLEVAGEFASIAEARAAGVSADALLQPLHAGELTAETVIAETLTRRETQVLELMAEGLSNRAIGDRLGISDQTVKFHVAAIHGKLGAANRTDAVRRAARRGLVAL
jgi:DNA-binding NarL/FixJ family response regulator